jgi:signal transduction histidine kinase
MAMYPDVWSLFDGGHTMQGSGFPNDRRRRRRPNVSAATASLSGPHHVFQDANPQYCQMVGREDLVGKTYLEAFPELVGTGLPEVLDHVFQTGEPFFTEEYAAHLDRAGDGTKDECFFRFNLQPLRDREGAVCGMTAVAADLTEQRIAQRVLKKVHAEHQRLLSEVQSASRAKDEFLAMLGHELRNPLSPAVTALQVMKLRSGGRLNRELQVIDRQVHQLALLVDELLDLSSMTRGKVQLRRESVDISEVLTKAVETSSLLVQQRGHRLSVDLPAGELPWSGDPARLAQVIGILLSNAARYTDYGGRIHLQAFRDGDEIVVRVKDNGSGISAETLPTIFDLFVQGKRKSDRAQGGLGIGLTMAKNLVVLHGGRITCTSDGPAKGSEFVIRLPSAGLPEQASPPAPENYRPPSSIQPKRILVVDDNVDAAEMLGELLQDGGHQVQVAHHPAAAVAMLDTFQPEIAVLDIGLPGMDGYELAARVRRSLKGSHCRLIALTGYGQNHDRTRSTEAGFTHHLVKPVDIEVLMKIVEGD